VGDALPTSQAPQVAGKSLTIKCTVEPEPAGGVIVSHGGSVIGYTLYLKNNRAVFAVRHAKQVTRVTSAELPAGQLKLEAQLAADGRLTLAVNGQSAEPVKAAGPLAEQPFEEFNVGFDGANTVDEYDGSKRFQGTIRDLSITVQP